MLPDLAKEIAWWQAQMRPTDPAFGVGISDWTITAEYVDGLSTPEHGQVWGVTCSPSSLPEIVWLTPEDIAAKRAHLMFRTPKTADEIAELHETIPHELVHVLDARKDGSVADMENTAHSLAPLLAELRLNDLPRAASLARAIANPARARAYRAGEGQMPDPSNETDKEKKEPMAQGAGEVDAAAIVDAVSTNDGNKALAVLKKLLESAAQNVVPSGESVAPEPTLEAPTMGMKPEEAYARKIQEANKEAVEAILDANPHLDDKQRAVVRRQPTPAAAREVVGTYRRPAEQPEKPTMGMTGHPSTAAGGAAALTVRARALQADPAVMARIKRGASDEDTLGLHLDEPGHVLAFSPSQLLSEQYGAFKRAQKGAAA